MWFHRVLLAIPFVILVSSCTVFESGAYLDPIPQETIFAFESGADIETKLQAVIAARQKLLISPHFFCANTPEVLSVEKLSFIEAYNQVKTSGSNSQVDNPEAMAWLVIFECDIEINFSPLGEEQSLQTAPSQYHGCMYTIIEAKERIGGIIGTTKCPSE